jgi:c-di-GMP-binding flagellar brake protein YcgR
MMSWGDENPNGSVCSFLQSKRQNKKTMPPQNVRRDPRIELINEVTYEVKHSEVKAASTDVSRSGIFIQTMNPLSVGEQVKLSIRFVNGERSYRAVGVVRHSLKWVGMGLEFTHLHPEARKLIDSLAHVEMSEDPGYSL